MLEVRHFELVREIARAGSVTGAARRLHLTQPAVSHVLNDLETRLGVRLFRRHSRGMEPTPEGARMLEAADTVLAEVRAVEDHLRDVGRGDRGTLRVTTECYTTYFWLPRVLGCFEERHPEVEVEIVADALGDPLDALRTEEIDIAIVHSASDDDVLLSERIFEDELLLVVPPDHSLADRDFVEPADLAGETLILHSDPATSVVHTEFLEPAGVAPARLLTLHLTSAVLQAVRAGLGVTVMASWAIRPELEAGRFRGVGLGEAGIRREWQLLTRRDRARRTSVQEFARLLITEGALEPLPRATNGRRLSLS